MMQIVRVDEVPLGWEIVVETSGARTDGSAKRQIFLILPGDLPDPLTRASLKALLRGRIATRRTLRKLLERQTL